MDIAKQIEDVYVAFFGHPEDSTYVSSIVDSGNQNFNYEAFVFFLLCHISFKHPNHSIRKEASSRKIEIGDRVNLLENLEFIKANAFKL